MNACEMNFIDDSFHIIIDKGTFDCIICNEKGLQDVSIYLKHVFRVLKEEGYFICVTHG